MDSTINPMKRVIMSRADPPSLALAARETSNKTSQVTTPATAIATRAVTGRPNPVWAAESVMTPVMVPGLASLDPHRLLLCLGECLLMAQSRHAQCADECLI